MASKQNVASAFNDVPAYNNIYRLADTDLQENIIMAVNTLVSCSPLFQHLSAIVDKANKKGSVYTYANTVEIINKFIKFINGDIEEYEFIAYCDVYMNRQSDSLGRDRTTYQHNFTVIDSVETIPRVQDVVKIIGIHHTLLLSAAIEDLRESSNINNI